MFAEFTVKGNKLRVIAAEFNAAMMVYDEWISGLGTKQVTREQRLDKIALIAANAASKSYMEDGELVYDYYAPERLKRVILSELGKRSARAKAGMPLFSTKR